MATWDELISAADTDHDPNEGSKRVMLITHKDLVKAPDLPDGYERIYWQDLDPGSSKLKETILDFVTHSINTKNNKLVFYQLGRKFIVALRELYKSGQIETPVYIWKGGEFIKVDKNTK